LLLQNAGKRIAEFPGSSYSHTCPKPKLKNQRPEPKFNQNHFA